MFDVKSHKWTTIYECKDCDLQHTCIRRGTQNWLLFTNKWDEKSGWNVAQLTLDDSFEVLREEAIIMPDGGNLVEPWTICVISDDLMAVYDYKLGGISLYAFHDGKWRQSEIVGVVLAGQWVSLAADENFVYVSCSDERVIRRFKRSK
ncbi:unnamed protein product [Toxocara canis]|uniref:FBA_1 domain-containing protein n=1 Tax=Toxocara canis TaxID=6265 RepID=A0A183UW71_TOXCA|nr:unnamed protein product [Toxocara canis]